MSTASGRAWRVLAPVALAACGVLLITSARAADGDDLRGSGHTELSDLVRAEEQRTLELSATVDLLTDEVDALTAQGSDPAIGEYQEEIDELREAAGMIPVRGPGLTVTLDDATLPADLREAEGVDIEAYLVHQQDLEGVINALWAGGAEAMMLMDQRIISTSSVKCIGPVLILQGRRYAPPYTVSVVGDVDAMLAALGESPVLRTYRAVADQIGLGYDVTVERNLAMVGHDGPVDISPETSS